MDRARRLFELQIVLERRTELEAKTRQLQLEEQFEFGGQGQLPLQQGHLPPPMQQHGHPAHQVPQPWQMAMLGGPSGWPGPWQCPLSEAARGLGPPGQPQLRQLFADHVIQHGRAQAVQIYPERQRGVGAVQGPEAWPV